MLSNPRSGFSDLDASGPYDHMLRDGFLETGNGLVGVALDYGHELVHPDFLEVLPSRGGAPAIILEGGQLAAGLLKGEAKP
jgi:hypothetical protein